MQAQTTATARRQERRRDWNQPPTPLRTRGEILIADGFGITVSVERSQLVVRDGAGRHRRERHFGRATSNLARLVVLGGSGTLSLDAIRWLDDVGAALVCIDRDGKILCSCDPAKSEAKLRRAQALAPFNPSGLAVAKALLTQKPRRAAAVTQLATRERLRRADARAHAARARTGADG
jgi:CRISPR/Cas system-associated endonuclease Cas1